MLTPKKCILENFCCCCFKASLEISSALHFIKNSFVREGILEFDAWYQPCSTITPSILWSWKNSLLFLPHSLHCLPAHRKTATHHGRAESLEWKICGQPDKILSACLREGNTKLSSEGRWWRAGWHSCVLHWTCEDGGCLVAGWGQLAHTWGTGVFQHRAHYTAQHSPCPRNPGHFRINRYMFLSWRVMVYEIGPLSLSQ